MKILFVDCDGTIREPKSGAKFISAPSDQQIIQGADRAIAYYASKNWRIIGITNQAGVAAGHKSLEEAIEEQQITLELFPEISEIFFCPDWEGNRCFRVGRGSTDSLQRQEFPHPDIPGELLYSSFRKPGSGMIARALDCLLPYLPDEIEDMWMVGDRPEDRQCAAAAEINFMWADIWRYCFTRGMGDMDVTNHDITREELLAFLATKS
jgi:D-glycero-D-manno-heptose 1,7-bisphosphate phosphatase